MNKLRFSSALTVFRYCLPVLLFIYPAIVSAQADYCDSSLEKVSAHPLGYRMRGERCEEVYIKEVFGSTLRIVSFTGYFEDYDLNTSKALTIDWSIPTETDIQIRAHGLKRKLYYRMDAVRPPSSTSYEWPTDILSALNIQKKDIGVTGWIRYSLGETLQWVYLPLRITQKQKPLPSGNYRLVIMPGRELLEVFVSLATVGANGQPDVFILEGKPLNYGYYPADREIIIPISHLKEKGVYFTEIGATLSGGGAATLELRFYHIDK